MISKQFSLESSYKELNSQLEHRKLENRDLLRKLDSERGTSGEREREVGQLQSALAQQESKHKQLVEKVKLCGLLGTVPLEQVTVWTVRDSPFRASYCVDC